MKSLCDAEPITASTREISSAFSSAEEFFWDALALMSEKGHVSQVRNHVVSLASISAFQASFGKITENAAQIATGLLSERFQ